MEFKGNPKYSKSDSSTCANARMDIDYRGQKPKIKISYPGDPKKQKPPAFMLIFLLFPLFG